MALPGRPDEPEPASDEVVSFGGRARPSRRRFTRSRRVVAVIAVPVAVVAGLYFAGESLRGSPSPYEPWMERYDDSENELKATLFDYRMVDGPGFIEECRNLQEIAADGEELPPTGKADADAALRSAVHAVSRAASTCASAWGEIPDPSKSFAVAATNASAWFDAFRKLNAEPA